MGLSRGVNCICKYTWKIPFISANLLSGFTAQPLRSQRSSMGCKHLEAAASSRNLPPCPGRRSCRRLYLNIQFLPLLAGVSFFFFSTEKKIKPLCSLLIFCAWSWFPCGVPGSNGKSFTPGREFENFRVFSRGLLSFLSLSLQNRERNHGILWSNPRLVSLHCWGKLRPFSGEGKTFFPQLKKKKVCALLG